MQWFYFDQNDIQRGPFTSSEFKKLALTGILTPSTKIATDQGHVSIAKKIDGLEFQSPEMSHQLSLAASQDNVILEQLNDDQIKAKKSGYVYVLINTSMPGLVKIGKTTKDPEERAKELSASTSSPSPFILVYYRRFSNCNSAEKLIHAALEHRGSRFKKEFFKISCTDAINMVLAIDDKKEGVVDETIDNETEKDTENIGMIHFQKGTDYYCGNDDCFQDIDKALSNYQKAVEYGVAEAHQGIGNIYYYEQGDIPKAIKEYREGAEKGNIFCYAQLGIIYMSEEDYINDKNANLAWKRFFAKLHSVLPDFSDLVVISVASYLIYSHLSQKPIDPKWEPTIQQLKNELILCIKEKLRGNSTVYFHVLDYLNQATDSVESLRHIPVEKGGASSGISNELVEGLRRLYLEGWNSSIQFINEVAESVDTQISSIGSIRAFANEYLLFTGNKKQWIPFSVVYQAYVNFCNKSDLDTKTNKWFGKGLKDVFPSLDDTESKRIRGIGSKRCYKGLTFKPEHFEYMNELLQEIGVPLEYLH